MDCKLELTSTSGRAAVPQHRVGAYRLCFNTIQHKNADRAYDASQELCLKVLRGSCSSRALKPQTLREESRRSRTVTCRAASAAEKVAEELDGESLEKWTACVDRVKGLGFEADNAEQIVGQAFGWGKQSYWLNKKENQVPNEEQVEAVLGYLEGDLDIKGEALQKVLKKFPEVINCDVEKRLKANVQHMQKAYYMKEPAAISTVKRRPEVLGFTYDCEGSCEGLCNQCWVRL